MRRNHMVAIFVLLFLAVIYSTAYAVPKAPHEDKGIYMSKRFMQWDLPWKYDYYAGKEITENGRVVGKYMRDHGCLVTALAMLFNYHGLMHIPDVSSNYAPKIHPNCIDSPTPAPYCQFFGIYLKTDPGTLNEWLTENNVYWENETTKKDGTPYVEDNLTMAEAVWRFWVRYEGVGIHNYYVEQQDSCQPVSNKTDCYEVPWSSKAETLLDVDIMNENPDILKISWTKWNGEKRPSHFVLIGGYSKDDASYRAYDPNQGYDRDKMYPPGLKKLYSDGDESFEPLRINRFKSEYYVYPYAPDRSYIILAGLSPIELQVIDPQENATGYDSTTGAKVTNIPHAYYGEESESSLDDDASQADPAKTLFINKPVGGNYIIKIFGTGDGPYTMNVRGVNKDGEANLDTSITGTATPGLTETYRVSYSPTGEATLSQDNQPPIVNAGADQTGEQSYEITLDGSGSHDPDGDPMTYAWSFVSTPDGSTAVLSDASAVNPVFTPDKAGTYVLQLVMNDYFTDSSPDTVTITATPVKSRISVTPNYNEPLSEGDGHISFDLNNIGRVAVSSGIIEASLTGPDGTAVASGSGTFSLTTGQSAILSAPVSIPSLKFGDYTLTYTQSDETRTNSPATVRIPNSASATFSFDMESYNVRETANLTLDLTNTGKFNFDNVSTTLSVPDAGFTVTQTVSLPALGSSQITYAIPIPDTIAAGQHSVDVSLTLTAGSTVIQSAKLNVPASKLVLRYAGPTAFTAGDDISLTIENTGGVDTTYSTENLYLSSGGVLIYHGSVTGAVLSGEQKLFKTLQIPSQSASGSAFLHIDVKDGNTGNRASLSRAFEITGLTASVQTRTDKDIYLKTEAVTGISGITTGAYGMEDGSLILKVVKHRVNVAEQFKHFLPKGWWPYDTPYGVDIGPDGSFYVMEYYDGLVYKFDSNGKFITKWGSPGSGDGQFSWLGGVAVGPDGFVYVLDSGNARVQKFDGDGNFITKWGSFGCGSWSDGFCYPYGITVAPDGSVFVADTNNHRIQKFDGDGNHITMFGSQGSGNGQFNRPQDIVVTPEGSLYVADAENNRIQEFDGNGTFISKWGSYGSGDGQFSFPGGIALGPDGSVYVSDGVNHRIQKFDSNGIFLAKWGTQGAGNGQFYYPYGIAVTAEGSVYVADTNNHRIQKFDDNGNFLAKWQALGSGMGEFHYPQAITVAPDGSLYVADTSNNRIQKFDYDGNFIAAWGSYGNGDGQFSRPYGITIAQDGSFYVADMGNSRIQKFDSNGNFIAAWGSYGSGDGQLWGPQGITVVQDGSVYVVDTNNHRVQKFDGDGAFIEAWGSYGTGYRQFRYPSGIAVTSEGFLYVADSSNHRVQKLDADGNLIATWGSYGSGNGQFFYPDGLVVAPDGSVYVTDRWNNRVQKFDNNGNFIAKWGSEGAGDGQFYHPTGIAIGPDNTLYVAETYNSRIQKMALGGSVGMETFFETTVPITQPAGTTHGYTTDIGTLDTTGKLYLQAELTNNLGQSLASAEYPFYIIEGDTALLFSADKKVYKPGETVTISGEVRNLSEIEAENETIEVRRQISDGTSETIFTEAFSVPAGGSHAFTTTTTADAEGTVALTGTVSQNNATLVEITDQYDVASPKVTAIVTAPGVAGNEPFSIDLELKNEGKIDSSIQYSVVSSQGHTIDTQQITIPAGESKLLQYSDTITSDTIYTFIFTGDLTTTMTKTVMYGLAAQITIGSGGQGQGANTYPEGRISIPVTITNTGQLGETVTVAYGLQPSGTAESRNYYLPAGGSITETLSYDLTAGNYVVSAVATQPDASALAEFSVLGDDEADMTTTPGSQGADGLIPVTMTVTNTGYNEINGTVQLVVVDSEAKVAWRGEAAVSGLGPQASTSTTISIDPSGMAYGAYPIETVLYSASGLRIAVNQAEIRTKGPIFEIVSVPNTPTFTVGREASLAFTIKNTGTGEGDMSFSVKTMDILDSSAQGTLQPGEEKTYTSTFTVPEDAEAKEYAAEYVLTSAVSQGTKGSAAFNIAGIKVNTTASVDKSIYRNGDTAILTLTVEKQASFEDGTYVAIIRYGAYHDMQPFTLSAQPTTLTFNVPLEAITGEPLFYGIHFESGRRISGGALSLNTLQADLAASFGDEQLDVTIEKDGTSPVNITVGNYGKTTAEATSVTLYDGDNLVEEKAVNALNPEEAASVTVDWNVLGKAGEHQLYAVVDPQELVTEYSEENNVAFTTVQIPNMAIVTGTDKDTYKIRQKVFITSTLLNLTASNTYSDLTMTTTATNPSGEEVYTTSSIIPSLGPASSTTRSEIWNTAGLLVDGTYTITQEVLSGSQLVTRSSKLVTLLPAPDFTLATDVDARQVKQGEEALYTASVNPFNGWNNEVSLTMEGLPTGTTAAFDPSALAPPGQSLGTVFTTNTTPAGTHTFHLVGQGVDEGETVEHMLPLTLDVAAFGLETALPSQTVQQLGIATYTINLTSQNGYEGTVGLTVADLPFGVKASFGSEHYQVPAAATLTVLTSKYVRPGAYTLTFTGDDGFVTHSLDMTLIIQANPDLAAGIITTPGPGPKNEAWVRVYNSQMQLMKELTAFNTEYGARAVSADIDGDGYDEIVVAQGPGPRNTASLRVFKQDGTMMAEYTAFDTRYGLTLSAGDLDGDWRDELIVGMGPDPKNSGILKVLKYRGDGFTELMSQTLYSDRTYGINTTTGDIDGDGLPEIITTPGPGPNSPATVTVWKYTTDGLTEHFTFTAFDGMYGANVATGDIDGDGLAEIITGSGPDPKNTALVRVYKPDGTLVNEFTPYPAKHNYGTTVSAGDLDSDGVSEIVTGLGPGPQNEPLVKIFESDGTETGSLTAYPGKMGYGVNVSIGRTGSQ